MYIYIDSFIQMKLWTNSSTLVAGDCALGSPHERRKFPTGRSLSRTNPQFRGARADTPESGSHHIFMHHSTITCFIMNAVLLSCALLNLQITFLDC